MMTHTIIGQLPLWAALIALVATVWLPINLALLARHIRRTGAQQ
jgi:hypothetical protein